MTTASTDGAISKRITTPSKKFPVTLWLETQSWLHQGADGNDTVCICINAQGQTYKIRLTWDAWLSFIGPHVSRVEGQVEEYQGPDTVETGV